jgi:hypothetical protein
MLAAARLMLTMMQQQQVVCIRSSWALEAGVVGSMAAAAAGHPHICCFRDDCVESHRNRNTCSSSRSIPRSIDSRSTGS